MNHRENPTFLRNGLEFEWDVDEGLFLIMGAPIMCMWTETTMAYFMTGLHKMVGTDRFNLALYGAGEDTTADEWERFVDPAPTVEDGLRAVCAAAPHLGHGQWELVALNRDKRE